MAPGPVPGSFSTAWQTDVVRHNPTGPCFCVIFKKMHFLLFACNVFVQTHAISTWLLYSVIKLQIKLHSDVCERFIFFSLMSAHKDTLLCRRRPERLQHSGDPSLSRGGWIPVSGRRGARSHHPRSDAWPCAEAAVWLLHVFIPGPWRVIMKPSEIFNTHVHENVTH